VKKLICEDRRQPEDWNPRPEGNQKQEDARISEQEDLKPGTWTEAGSWCLESQTRRNPEAWNPEPGIRTQKSTWAETGRRQEPEPKQEADAWNPRPEGNQKKEVENLKAKEFPIDKHR
jgi:hypothetical protein